MRGIGNRAKKKSKPPDQAEQSKRFVEEARKLGVTSVSEEEFGRVFKSVLGSKAMVKAKTQSRKRG